MKLSERILHSPSPVGLVAVFLIFAVAGMTLATRAGFADQHPASLTVTVTGISPRGGNLRVGVYTENGFDAGAYKPALLKTVPAGRGSRKVTFADIPPGDYAVKVVQDVNRDGRADHTMFGSRREPVGYSRNYSRKGTPDFRDVCFSVTTDHTKITVRLN